MKITHFSFWPYVIVAGLLSYLLFMISGDLFLENKDAVIGISGFLIAGSWSFLSIETNKEIRRRDELIRFINEYEEAVFNFVNSALLFYQKFDKLKSFVSLDKIGMENINNKKMIGDVTHDIERHNLNYSDERKSLLYEEIRSQMSILKYANNVVNLRGSLLKPCVFSGKEIDNIKFLCKEVLFQVEESSDKNNIESKDPTFSVNAKKLTEMQQSLYEVMSEKMKNFEERSEDYAEKQNLCVFLIIFGFFFSFWNFISLSFN